MAADLVLLTPPCRLIAFVGTNYRRQLVCCPTSMAAAFAYLRPGFQLLENLLEWHAFQKPERVVSGQAFAGCGGAADPAEKSGERTVSPQRGMAFGLEGVDHF